MSVSDEDAQVRADFEEMVRTAARDNRVTGLKYSLQQIRSGAYSLLGAAFVSLSSGLLCWFSATLQAVDTFRFEHLRIAAALVFLVASGVLFILYFYARRDRYWPLPTGLALYCLLLVPVAVVLSSITSFLLYIEFLVLIALVDGVRAGYQHSRILWRALDGDQPPQ